ncbi:hypothetical protein [Thysanoplusia orichalcea nucleopolyhedrovirus]|uniref:Uncharacterized protein n=1 Tax=Thysanoplusia orichalcea nucleopolyhedrovirus TaxID=101850 RepID=L0CM20_9ABAC|nr:hypothetical protein [Thysanoplusia orichalcea nucleopolyhedrovirus]AGA16271.1 hypothetical protein [Thysanoplusia orichalcea nucleopolyhedrovirus]
MKVIIVILLFAAMVAFVATKKSLPDPLNDITTIHFNHPDGIKRKIRRPYNEQETKLIQCRVYL